MKFLARIRVWLLGCFIFGLVVYGVLGIYVARFTGATTAGRADMAIILGAKSYKEGKYNPCLVARVEGYENFVYSKEVMQREGLSSAIVVTEPFHIGRARLIAKMLGVSECKLHIE